MPLEAKYRTTRSVESAGGQKRRARHGRSPCGNRGKRAAPKRKGAEPFNVGPSIGLASTGKPGEFRLNMNQIEAIQQLYTSSPAIAAARPCCGASCSAAESFCAAAART